MDMRACLSLWNNEKENDSSDDGRMNAIVKRLSLSFTNHDDAEECFRRFSKMKDCTIAEALLNLLEESDFQKAMNLRDTFLKRFGEKHSSYKFLESISQKCACSLFGTEHVYSIIDHIISIKGWDSLPRVPAINLLLAIISNFPSLLRGSESQFKELLLEDDSITGIELLQVLAKAAPYISMSLSDVYPALERLCFEGSRAQCKAAIYAMSAFPGPSTHFALMDLCQKLVASLHNGQNILTVLKSLSCIAHCSISTFEEQAEEISSCIREKIFPVWLDDASTSSENYKSDASFDCQAKIYGVKTIVKGFLLNKVMLEPQSIDHLQDMLFKLLQNGGFRDGSARCENDKACFRLAAAKSVLCISQRWDAHIVARLFSSAVMIAKDSAPFVRKSFLDKVHVLLSKHALPTRYACAFSLAASDCLKDLQDTSFNYLGEFIKDYSRAVRKRKTTPTEARSVVDSPVYVVVFLLHVLAHDVAFPFSDCLDDEVNVLFYRPLACILHSLLTAGYFDGDHDFVRITFLHLVCIFRAVKRAEDAVDPQKTPKLHLLADIGLTILDAIEQNVVNKAHAPGSVLLPSSLYRTCAPLRLPGQHKYLVSFETHKNFVKQLLEPYGIKFNQHTIFEASSHRKVRKGAAQSNLSENSAVELKACSQAESMTNRSHVGSNMNEMETATALVVSTKAKRTMISPSSPTPLGLTESITVSEKDEPIPVARKGQLLLLDSVGSEVSEVGPEVLTQEADLLLLTSGKEERKRKDSCSSEILDLHKTKFRNTGSDKVPAVSFSQQSESCSDPELHRSLESLIESIVPSGVDDVAPRASTSKANVFLDRTNLLTVNHLKDQGQQKANRAKGLKNSQKVAAVQVHDGNRSAIAFRTRRRRA